MLTMKNNTTYVLRHVQWMLSEQVLARWWHLVTFRKATNLLRQTMHAVLYRRTAMAIEMASKVGACFHCHWFACRPGSRRGNTERVVAQWQLPGTSNVSLDMLHQAMPRTMLQCILMAIEMACDGGTVAHHCCHFCLL